MELYQFALKSSKEIFSFLFEDKESMMYKVFQATKENPSNKDFVITCKKVHGRVGYKIDIGRNSKNV